MADEAPPDAQEPPASDPPAPEPAAQEPAAPEPAAPPPEAPAPAAPQPSPLPTPTILPKADLYFPILITTACFGALFIILPLLVRKGPYKGLIRCCIMLSLFCVWIFWVTIYVGHMNPLMGPRVRNTTLAWMAYKIGNPAKPASAAEVEPANL